MTDADDVRAPTSPGVPLAFLSGGGELGRLIRAKDWSTTPLGPPETWPQSLRTSVSTCLNCSFPILIWWGPDLVKIYNDAYAEIIAAKHPWALGSPGRDVWPEIWDTIGPMLSRVMAAGEAFPADDLRLDLHRKGYPEECYFSFSYSPIRDENDHVAGVFCPVIETTKHVFAERRAAFLLDLEARLRDVSDPLTVKAAVCDLLGPFLGATRAVYVEVLDDDDHVRVEGAWNDGDVAGLSGRHRLDDFGPELIADLRRNLVVAVEDVRRDPRTSASDIAAAYAEIEVRAFLDVPLFEGERLAAYLCVADAAARRWTDHEIALMRELADRTWSTVMRTRSEAEHWLAQSERERNIVALEVSEARFRAAVEAVDGVLWTNDADGKMAGEQPGWAGLTGQTQADYQGVGWSRAIHPEDVQETLEAWNAAVRARRLFKFEHRVRRHDGRWRHFNIRAAPIIDPQGDVVEWVGVHTDITNQKLTEEALQTWSDELEARVQQEVAEREQAQSLLVHAQRMEALGQLAGGIAHDFNNVLQAVTGGST